MFLLKIINLYIFFLCKHARNRCFQCEEFGSIRNAETSQFDNKDSKNNDTAVLK